MEKKEMPLIQNLDNNPLLSNQHAIVHNPDKFIIDFKGLYPQFTPDNKPQMVLTHKVVVLEPYVAKEFVKSLSDNIKKYEDKFGKIKEPKAVEKARKESKKADKKNKSTTPRPSYMG
ncbi:hypothetical protein AYK26_06270 [Euryarchaeota archaeon SM23-78]|nr:MAG: hypothetical protein AYK26_06270 [Euryarchaeota archaeon SM23-78]